MMDAMRKLLLGTTLTLAIAFVSPASAMPAGYPLLRDAAVSIEVGDAKVGGKPLGHVKPRAQTGCKLVGTVGGTKLWAGDCVAAPELRGTTPTPEPEAPAPSPEANPPADKQ